MKNEETEFKEIDGHSNNNIVRGHTLLQVSRRRMDFDTVLCKNRSRSFL